MSDNTPSGYENPDVFNQRQVSVGNFINLMADQSIIFVIGSDRHDGDVDEVLYQGTIKMFLGLNEVIRNIIASLPIDHVRVYEHEEYKYYFSIGVNSEALAWQDVHSPFNVLVHEESTSEVTEETVEAAEPTHDDQHEDPPQVSDTSKYPANKQDTTIAHVDMAVVDAISKIMMDDMKSGALIISESYEECYRNMNISNRTDGYLDQDNEVLGVTADYFGNRIPSIINMSVEDIVHSLEAVGVLKVPLHEFYECGFAAFYHLDLKKLKVDPIITSAASNSESKTSAEYARHSDKWYIEELVRWVISENIKSLPVGEMAKHFNISDAKARRLLVICDKIGITIEAPNGPKSPRAINHKICGQYAAFNISGQDSEYMKCGFCVHCNRKDGYYCHKVKAYRSEYRSSCSVFVPKISSINEDKAADNGKQ